MLNTAIIIVIVLLTAACLVGVVVAAETDVTEGASARESSPTSRLRRGTFENGRRKLSEEEDESSSSESDSDSNSDGHSGTKCTERLFTGLSQGVEPYLFELNLSSSPSPSFKKIEQLDIYYPTGMTSVGSNLIIGQAYGELFKYSLMTNTTSPVCVPPIQEYLGYRIHGLSADPMHVGTFYSFNSVNNELSKFTWSEGDNSCTWVSSLDLYPPIDSMKALAFDSTDQLWGHDYINVELVRIDKTNGSILERVDSGGIDIGGLSSSQKDGLLYGISQSGEMMLKFNVSSNVMTIIPGPFTAAMNYKIYSLTFATVCV